MLNLPNKKKYKFFFIIIFSIAILLPASIYAAISCSVTTSALCSGTVLLRMSGSTNAHAELPTQSTTNYDSNVVCCTGVTGLSNSCASSNKVIFARLSGVTNAHVEKNTESNPNYTQNACLASTYAGDIITVGYQTTNCTGYDTTLFSMEKTPTNSMVGNTSAYTNKVCAKIVTQSISVNLSSNSAGFGYLSSTGPRYATSSGTGSNTETEAFNVSVTTNASNGYTMYITGDTLKNGIVEITPLLTNTTPTPGTNAFGLRAVPTGAGNGTVLSPYAGSGFAFDATSTTPSYIAESTSGDGLETIYSMRTVATIDSVLDYGNYSTNLTYIIVPNY